MKRFASMLLIAILGGVSALGLNHFFFSKSQNSNNPGNQATQTIPASFANLRPSGLDALPDFRVTADLTVHAVVHIRTEYERKSSVYDDFFGMPDPFRDFFFGPGNRQRGNAAPIVASGSGVIISDDGYIVTNNHVVTEADKIEVTLNDNRIYEARIIGLDPATDLALIKIDEKELPFLQFGNSDEVMVGEWVLAVGNPFNLTSTVTAGIVSAKGRNINILGGGSSIESFIQTDAAVNSGNSGGALVNTHGELIGINAAIASNTGSYTGYSFAIPSNIARKVVKDLMEYGEVQRGFLGVEISELNSRIANEKGLDIFRGAYVENVREGSAAAKAGIKTGDVILKIDSTEIKSPSDLLETVARHRPGDKLNIQYRRDSKDKETTATLQNVQGDVSIVKREDSDVLNNLGASFEPVSESELSKLGIKNGVKIAAISAGKFRSSGIREGFIITHIDRKPITSPADITQTLKNKKGGVLVEGIYPNGVRAYYGLGL